MLQTLRVKNLAIVENVRVEFAPGLNVVTGETGAGKSILAGALTLILGGRGDKSVIRAGEESCGVEAVFSLSDPAAVNTLLADLGIEPCENGQLIVRRIVSASGAGKLLVNGSAATVQMLKSVGDLLVDMHGPHDHQSLLNRDFQLAVLDSFAGAETLLEAYRVAYRDLLDREARLKALDGDDRQVSARLDMLTFQVKEIAEAALTEADETDLPGEHTRVANAQRILELANALNHALAESDECAFNALVRAQAALSELDPLLAEAGEWRAEAESIAIRIQELAASVAAAAQSIEADPRRMEWLEDRMALVHNLKRKYGATVGEVLVFFENARRDLDELENRGERIAAAAADLEQARRNTRAAGRALSASRNQAAASLAEAITAELRGLGFEHGAFAVSMQPREPGPSGMDEIEFGFAPNAGEPMRPLRAIASSGEISRVMLATKVVLAAYDGIPVLVFDEIDANVGGKTANAVGEKLASVAAARQVLCITHLPQVAVYGHSHYVVTKIVEDGRTRTLIAPIVGDERAAEIARMLGGKDLTSVTMKHAREMLRKTAPEPRT